MQHVGLELERGAKIYVGYHRSVPDFFIFLTTLKENLFCRSFVFLLLFLFFICAQALEQQMGFLHVIVIISFGMTVFGGGIEFLKSRNLN